MKQQPSISKIYSRKRLNIIKPHKNYKRYKNEDSKIGYILIIMIIAITTSLIIWKAIDPIFENVCEDKARSIATKITNEQSSKAMEGYSYADLFTIEKDTSGNIQMINANIFTIDTISSDIAKYIQDEINNTPSSSIKLTIGSFTGIKVLAGIGPTIKIKISSAGSVDTSLKSEFVSQGINQTMHRIYLDIRCNISILTPFKTINQEVTNQVLLAENVIVGQIPSNYYNFQGTDEENTSLKVIN